MPEVRVQVKDTLSPALGDVPGRVLAGMAREVEAEGLRLQGRVQRYLKDSGIYDTGELRRSVHQRTARGFDFVASTVATNTDYAKNVHEGTKPGHWAPISPLIDWARRRVRQGRFTLSTPKGSRRRRGAKLSPREQEIRGIAYAVRAGIYKHGTKGRPFMDTVFTQEEPGIRSRLQRRVVLLTQLAVRGE